MSVLPETIALRRWLRRGTGDYRSGEPSGTYLCPECLAAEVRRVSERWEQ